MAYVYAASTVHVTIYSASGKLCLVSKFMELHALPVYSYALWAAKIYIQSKCSDPNVPFRYFWNWIWTTSEQNQISSQYIRFKSVSIN